MIVAAAVNGHVNGTAATAGPPNGDGLPIFVGSHRDKLAASGLSADTIRAAGIRSCGDRGELAAMLDRKNIPGTWGSCIVFPYKDESGAVILNRVRPDNPPLKNGKPAKYLSPNGAKVRAYIPPAAWPAIADPRARLVITEGELKSLAATQNGFPCLGLGGVTCWHEKKKTTPIPDLDRIPWKDREVFICFDSDAVTNQDVQQNERELAAILKGRGAKLKIVRIPPATDGAKMGLDDFLVAHGAAEFAKLLKEATEPEPPDAGELKDNAAEADPAVEADYILATCTLGKLPRLRFWRGSWWWWANGRYGEKPSEEVRGQVVNAMNDRWTGVRSRIVSDVMEQLRAKAMLPGSIEAPAWLTKLVPYQWPADECLATQNAIVHLPSLVDQCDPFQAPATPSLLTTTATEFALEAGAPPPLQWLTFLGSIWPDDPESISLLQEWFGYCITNDTRQHKGLLVVGPPRGGKGTIGRILTALVGHGNVAAPTLAGLGMNFGLWPLIGKSLAIISDARITGRADQAAVVERVLSITGEDSITIDRKNQQPITLRLQTRFMILTNELPRLSDASGAIVSRFLLLPTTRSWLGKEDHGLEKRLIAELPGILLWAIGGWKRLRDRGRFVQPAGGAEAIEDMADLASPVSAFIRDCCRVGAGEQVEKSILFSAWRRWCEQQGRSQFVGTLPSFCRDVLAVLPGVRGVRLRVEGGRSQAFGGISIRNDWSGWSG